MTGHDQIARLTKSTACLKILKKFGGVGAMTAKDLLDLNGDFRNSPLLDTARKLHRLLTQKGIPYVIIGGLSVIRNGAVRTTRDVDILVRKEDWPEVQLPVILPAERAWAFRQG